MGDYQNETRNASLLGSILAALGGGVSDGGSFVPGSTAVTLVGGAVDDLTSSTVAEDHTGAARMTTNRAIHVNLRDSNGNELSVGGGTQYTEDAAAAADPIGNALIVVRNDARTGALTSTDGDNIALRGNNTGALYVEATQSGTWNVGTLTGITNVVHVDDNAGSLTVDQSTAANLKVEPAGNVAHDAVDAGNPLKVGGRAKATLTGVTLVSADDRADVMTDLDGVLLARPQVPLGNLLSEVKTDTGGTSTAFSTFGASANLRNYITAVTISNSSASTFCTVDLRDGTAGSVLWTFPVPASGGVTMNFSPPLRQPTVNTALAMDPSAAVSTITVCLNGFQSKA